MLSLILTVVLFNLMMVGFKLFDKFNVDNRQAILVNYFVAGCCGLLFTENTLTFAEIIHSKWILHALGVGFGFITIFNLLALGTQKVGLTISTVANKMSLVIPVLFSLVVYTSDSFSWLKIGGVVLALVGVYFSSTDGGKLNFDKKYLWLIVIIFLGQGTADVIFNHAQQTAVADNEKEFFFTALFLIAGTLGLIAELPSIIKDKKPVKLNALLFGVLLGIPNYGTIYFFFLALTSSGFPPSAVYPIVSMGVVIISAIVGLLFFREKLTTTNWLGIGCAVVAIALISVS